MPDHHTLKGKDDSLRREELDLNPECQGSFPEEVGAEGKRLTQTVGTVSEASRTRPVSAQELQ